MDDKDFTVISNGILDALCGTRLSGSLLRLILIIIRNTQWGESSVSISLSELAEKAGTQKSHVSTQLSQLKQMGIIDIAPGFGSKKQVISLNADYTQWRDEVPGKESVVTENGNSGVTDFGNSGVTKNGNGDIYNNNNISISKINSITKANNIHESISKINSITKAKEKDKSITEIKSITKKESKSKNKSKKENTKKIYGEYRHVRLTDRQYEKLVEDYGEEITLEYIRRLDEYVQMKGAKYKDHNLTIRHWLNNANIPKLSEKEKEKHYYSEDDVF